MSAFVLVLASVYGVTALVGASGGVAWLVSSRFRHEIVGERRSPRD